MALLRRGDQDTGDDIGAGFIRDLYEKGSKDVRKQAHDFWINKSFVSGEQWIYWNSQTSRIEALPRDPTRVRFPVNKLRTNTRTLMAKLLRRPLAFEVLPDAADDASVAGARLGAAVLRDRHRVHNWERLRLEGAWATWLGGTGLLCLDWDPRAGAVIGEHPERKGEQVHAGDIRESALTICEAVTEPGTRDIERAAWWIRVAAHPSSEVQTTFGLKSEPKADASAALSPLQHKLLRDDGSDDTVSLTQVLHYYERPSSKRPKGLVAVVVGDDVVSKGPWPFPFKDRLNVVCMTETFVNGRWTGDTVLSDAIGPQTALNMSWSSQVEHGKLAGNARLMVPETAIDIVDLLTDEPGEPVPYSATPGMPQPSYLAPPTMPQWWSMQPHELASVIDDIFAQHDVSRGGAPAGVSSGIALTLLAEQDDTPLGQFVKTMAEAFGRFATLVLETYAARVGEDETRVAKAVASGKRPEIAKWNGKLLCGQTVAEVPLEAVQPRSRAAQWQMAMELKNMFPTEVGLAQFAAIADLPGSASIVEGSDPNIGRARSENHELSLGLVAIPEEWDNHATHIKEHNRFRMSDRYGQLDEDTRALFDEHVEGHETMAAEEIGKQVAKGAVSPALATAAQAGEPPLAGDAVPQLTLAPIGPDAQVDPNAAPAPQGP